MKMKMKLRLLMMRCIYPAGRLSTTTSKYLPEKGPATNAFCATPMHKFIAGVGGEEVGGVVEEEGGAAVVEEGAGGVIEEEGGGVMVEGVEEGG